MVAKLVQSFVFFLHRMGDIFVQIVLATFRVPLIFVSSLDVVIYHATCAVNLVLQNQ